MGNGLPRLQAEGFLGDSSMRSDRVWYRRGPLTVRRTRWGKRPWF
jgi:hypothetical protein